MNAAELISQKAEHYERERAEIAERVSVRDMTMPAKLALACRILAHHGHRSGLAGQVTARVKQERSFWTQSLGVGLEEAAEHNQLRVDFDLRLQQGSGMVNPANRFHAWIYEARADVSAVVHTHAKHCVALSMIGEPLAIAHMDAMPLFEDVAWLPEWPGVPYGDSEGEIITSALGSKRAVLLAHHGLLTVGASIEEATYLAVLFEQAAELHLLARSAGTIRSVKPEFGRDAREHSVGDLYATAHFNYFARQVARLEDPGARADVR